MRRCLVCLLLGVSTIIVGCNRPSTPAVASEASGTEVTASAPETVLATPVSAVQQPTPTPIILPTAAPIAPGVAPAETAEVTPAVAPAGSLTESQPALPPHPERYTAGGIRIVVTPIPAAPQVTCMPEGEVIACHDVLLDMEFSYPAFMGQLLYTTLTKGGYAGYAYEYAFDSTAASAGGRSRDFSEGRGPMYTDATGFNGRTAEEICEWWRAAMCQELGPAAVLIVLLPQAEWLCSDAMMFHTIPRAILVLDLPDHPLINGFAFTSQLVGAEAEAAFRAEWYGEDPCAPETKLALGAAMEQLQQDLRAGVAAAEIQHRYDAMIRIAESVRSPYVAVNP